MRYKVTFDEIRQSRKVRTFCTKCGKKLVRMLSETYYRNGLHDEVKTRRENDVRLDKEAKELAAEGTICGSCACEDA